MTSKGKETVEDSDTCSTVETPSRLMLFFPESTSSAIAALLPTQPVTKPVGEQVTMGRSGAADVRLNDERMSRLYVGLWHDGKDPFIFQVTNLSERKLLLVDGVKLRHDEQADVKDGSELVLDFLRLKARVHGGDFVVSSYQICFIKNVETLPAPVDLIPNRADLNRMVEQNLLPMFLLPVSTQNISRRRGSRESVDSVFVRSNSSGTSYTAPENQFGSEEPYLKKRSYSNPEGRDVRDCDNELQRNWASSTSSPEAQASSCSEFRSSSIHIPASTGLCLNIPPSPLESSNPSHQTASPLHLYPVTPYVVSSLSSFKDGCWFNPDPNPLPKPQEGRMESQPPSLSAIAQRVQDAIVLKPMANGNVCQNCGGGSVANGVTPPTGVMPREALRDLLDQDQALPRRSPVENEDWDTDDPNINVYMG